MASLNPLTGALGKRLAAHLLRRATYKVTPDRIDSFASLTPAQAVDKLFTEAPLKYPDGPILIDDAEYPNGIPAFILGNTRDSPSRRLYGASGHNNHKPANYAHNWRMVESLDDATAKWKVIHWLSSLFVTGPIFKLKNIRIYYHWRLLEKMSFGNLRTLAEKITRDNLMLTYLDNTYNVKTAPNENYAREFLELFTILKGPVRGIGDYTNYTEADISTAARVLTGFVDDENNVDPDTGIVQGRADISRHDTGDKTFSAAFGNRIIRGATTEDDMKRELRDFVKMVYDQDATAKSFARRMYLFFVGDKINPEIENDIITPLANQLKTNGYRHIPVLKTLLESQHFYDRDDNNSNNEIIGAKIKSPLELLLQTANLLNLSNSNSADYKRIFYQDTDAYHNHTDPIGMSLFGPPTVEGYAGFYKEPDFSKNWFSNNYLYKRYSFGKSFVRGKIFDSNEYFPFKVDLLLWAKNHVDLQGAPGTHDASTGTFNPIGVSNATYLVDMMLTYFLSEMPTGDRRDYFMNTLLGGLHQINWYYEWKTYLETGKGDGAQLGLERLFTAITVSPEFQTF
jgi:hypothetical protein